MWKNTVELGRPQITVLHICIACWISKATNTLSEYVIISDFPCKNGCTNVPDWYVIRT